MFVGEVKQDLLGGDVGKARELRIDEWLYQPGIPANAVPADRQAFAGVDQAVARFATGGALDQQAWNGWNTDERLRFLNKLPRKLPLSRLTALDRTLALSSIGNMEVRYAWLELVVANRYQPGVASLEQFLTTQGRRKFVRPLIKALAADSSWGRPIAARVYARARPLYHPMVTRELDELNLSR
jgi:hypothetical protein